MNTINQREAYELLTADNAALLLIDHQDGTMGWTSTIPRGELKRNTLLLAKAAKAIGMPIVMTTSMETEAQGPLMKELRDVAPEEYDSRIKREGIVDAYMDPAFAKAVKDTGRNRLIIAGVTTEVCVTFPTIRALREGFEVFVVEDASAAVTKTAESAAMRRMEKEGAVPVSTLQIVAELARSWALPEGKILNKFLFEDLFSRL
ncbi:isochorismatase family protein [Shimwellia pseudoproteus]|uniref:isochorismatase family protein n=1 Tax=Shimwellia pseudoproteus TaxID=570012 RepID=UPI0018EB2149|nr:isochorismatase family protein [Shimwellia pseudoproteus]MBJ3816486.1 isochorismatase family protein [Shimwellia pseudoproteus]